MIETNKFLFSIIILVGCLALFMRVDASAGDKSHFYSDCMVDCKVENCSEYLVIN
jgi:hypothetical protein